MSTQGNRLSLVAESPLRRFAREAVAAQRLQERRARADAFARAVIQCQATANSHRLSGWRPDPDRPGYELACCADCGAGVSVHVETAYLSPSDGIVSPCRVRRFPLLNAVER